MAIDCPVRGNGSELDPWVLRFEGVDGDPSRLRQLIARLLRDSSQLDDVLLVISELVSNVVRHAGSGGEVCITNGPQLRLSVTDASTVKPALGRAAALGDGGLGLQIVEKLSEDWSVEVFESGKIVRVMFDSPPS